MGSSLEFTPDVRAARRGAVSSLGRRLTYVAAALAVLFAVVRLGLPREADPGIVTVAIRVGSTVAVFLLAAAGTAIAAGVARTSPKEWTLIAFGLAVFPLGTLINGLYGFPEVAPWPAYVVWIVAYSIWFGVVIGSAWQLTRMMSGAMWLDLLVGVLALAALAVTLRDTVGAGRYTGIDLLLGFAYPLVDLLGFAILGWLIWAGGLRDRLWLWSFAGIGLLLAGDVASVLAAVYEHHELGSVIGGIFPLVGACFGLAAWSPPVAPMRVRVNVATALAAPGISMLIAVCVIVAVLVAGLPAAGALLAAAAILVGMVRGVVVYRQLATLLGSRRIERGFENAGLGMATIDEHGRWDRVNETLAGLLGRDASELTGLAVEETLTFTEPNALERLLAQPGTRLRGIHATVTGGEPGATELLCSGNTLLLRDGTPECFLQASDITRQRRDQRLALLVSDITRVALEQRDLRWVFDYAIEAVVDGLPAATVMIVAADATQGQLVACAGDEQAETFEIVPSLAGEFGECLERREPVVAHPAEHGTASVAVPVLPLASRPHVLHVTTTRDVQDVSGFDAQEHAFLEAVANILASTIDRVGIEERHRHDAHHDPLTGLANRTLLRTEMNDRLRISSGADPGFSLLLVDLDRFKDINDSRGHEAGDLVLTAAAGRIAGLGGDGVVARLGGDEFVVCVPTTDRDALEALALRIIAALSEPIFLGDRELRVGASVGVRPAAPGDSTEDMLRDADMAMYRAKQSGGGTHAFFDERMRAEALARITIEQRLRRAVDLGEFKVVVQPQFDLVSREPVAAEVLLRWVRPGSDAVPPATFIPLAEDSGLIVPVGAWVIDEAARLASMLDRLRISVNVSARQLEPGLVESVTGALERHGVDRDRFCIEVTESTIGAGPEQAAVLEALHRHGIRMSVDDFGTGWSSLAALQRQPVDELKLDRSLVGSITQSPSGLSIVRAAVDMARALGLTVVAEGIEHESELTELRELGCDLGQGFLLGRPMEAAELQALIAGGHSAPGDRF